MKRNVTLTVDEDLLREARVVALERQTSVNRLIRDHLAALVQRDSSARQRSPAKAVSEGEGSPWLGTILQMRGLGSALWKNEDPDEYVRALREDWSESDG